MYYYVTSVLKTFSISTIIKHVNAKLKIGWENSDLAHSSETAVFANFMRRVAGLASSSPAVEFGGTGVAITKATIGAVREIPQGAGYIRYDGQNGERNF